MHLAGLDCRVLLVPSRVRLDPLPSIYSTPLRAVLPVPPGTGRPTPLIHQGRPTSSVQSIIGILDTIPEID
jgi:hypothetical protein